MGRIVIIANGDKAIRTKKRELIDSSTVIRINRFHIEEYEDYVGTRTDIYSCGMKYLDFIDTSDEKRILECEDEFFKKLELYKINLSSDDVERYKKEYIKSYMIPRINSSEIQKILFLLTEDKSSLQKYPFIDKIKVRDFEMVVCYTTGMRTILYALHHYPNDEIFITGFNSFLTSGLKSGWYWDTKIIDSVVPPYKNIVNPLMIERDKIKELIKEKRIIEI